MTGAIMTSATDDLAEQRGASPLSGPQRVAALLLSLDKETAQRVLKHFDQAELRKIARCAAELGSVSAPTIEPLFSDFLDELSQSDAELVGSAGQAEQLLIGVVPADQVADIMSDVLGSSNSQLWLRVSGMSEAAVAGYLVNEHPQTIAIVAARVDPGFAARLLGQLPATLRNRVMRRMLVTRPVNDAVLRIIESVLQEDLMGETTGDSGAETNFKVAGIINQMEREQIEDVLQTISQTEPLAAEKLKKLLFSFEDIPKLNARAKTILFDQVATDQVIMALRGADNLVRGAVLPSLGARVRRMVEAELASPDLPPKQEIAKAQRAIANAVLKLSEQGLIDIGASDDAQAGGAPAKNA
jgi:flagellar motor switch protein FliG